MPYVRITWLFQKRSVVLFRDACSESPNSSVHALQMIATYSRKHCFLDPEVLFFLDAGSTVFANGALFSGNIFANAT